MILVQRSHIKILTSIYSKAASSSVPDEVEGINPTVNKDFGEIDIYNFLAYISLVDYVGQCWVFAQFGCFECNAERQLDIGNRLHSTVRSL